MYHIDILYKMFTLLQEYRIFKNFFPKLLELSGYKMEYLAERLGITPSSFTMKKKRNSFDLDEMEELTDIIWNDYLEDKFLAEAVKQAKKEGHLTQAQTKQLFTEWK